MLILVISGTILVNSRSKEVEMSNENDRMTMQGGDKKTRISFLKVPKTGSSTVACIFLRFGLNNNLSMFVPESAFIKDFRQASLLKQKKRYDVFVIHSKYNYTFFRNIVPNPDIIATVRRPDERLISQVFFKKVNVSYECLHGLSRQNVINEVVKNTPKYHLNNVVPSFFGIKDFKISETSLQNYLSKLKSEFTLVLILERFDESLVLLKRLLHWSVFDIIYSAKKKKENNDIQLSPGQIMRLKYTNKLEYAIYDFFNNELEKKIQNAGDNFAQEVAHFKTILKQTDEFCLTSNKTMPFYMFPSSAWDNTFSITRKDCYLIYGMDVPLFKRYVRTMTYNK